MCVGRHPPITQNNKVTISLQYIKKEMGDEIDILHVDKHESFLQIDLMGMVKHSQSSQNIKFAMS